MEKKVMVEMDLVGARLVSGTGLKPSQFLPFSIYHSSTEAARSSEFARLNKIDNLHVPIEGLTYKYHIVGSSNNTPFVEIKKSEVKNGGFGCFAGQDWEEGAVIGVYWGNFRSKGSILTDNAYTVETHSGNFRQASRRQKHMGYHFCNTSVPPKKPNVTIRADMLIETIRAIGKGEELIIDYREVSNESFHPFSTAARKNPHRAPTKKK
jgi:hypothetical protein